MCRCLGSLRIVFVLCVYALAATACGGEEGGGSGEPAKNGKNPTVNATKVYKALCVTCHGETGKGDGPGAGDLDPKPRTLTDKAWQDSVTDEHIKKTILYGGAAVGKSAAMPAQPQLRSKPETLDALVAHIRKFGEPSK